MNIKMARSRERHRKRGAARALGVFFCCALAYNGVELGFMSRHVDTHPFSVSLIRSLSLSLTHTHAGLMNNLPVLMLSATDLFCVPLKTSTLKGLQREEDEPRATLAINERDREKETER